MEEEEEGSRKVASSDYWADGRRVYIHMYIRRCGYIFTVLVHNKSTIYHTGPAAVA